MGHICNVEVSSQELAMLSLCKLTSLDAACELEH